MSYRPVTVAWYRAYCYFNLFLNLASIAVGVWMSANKDQLGAGNLEFPPDTWPLVGLLLVVVGIVFTIGSIVVLLLPNKPWAWTVHLINIALGLPSCTIVFCVPLAISWLKPEVKHYYGADRQEYPRHGGR